ncbi:DUF4129 domain-containing protein [Olivibacter ginsenosidimutans]|uniref:DUF4129 domain-containing protein n=2 Tax=Olivibacter ginsenosidimutans TaxID=1176537 RepID=A0ABP9CAG1_9SPHI
MRIALIILFFIFGTLPGSAQTASDEKGKTVKKPLTVQSDSSMVDLRSISKESLAVYKHDPTFNYEENIVPIGWWQQLKHWFYQLLQRIFASKGSAIALKWLLIFAGVFALLLLIYKLSGMDLMHIFRKSKTLGDPTAFENEENIHIINFEEELKQAIQAGNFRLAVRLLYLQSLKGLTDRQLIDWQPGKTNHAYLQELHETPLKKNFAQLTGQFEYIWYGGFPIQKQDFGHIHDDFTSFYQQIRN